MDIKTQADSLGDPIQDRIYGLGEMLGHWIRQEAWQLSYDQSIFDGSNKDSFGHSFGSDPAHWLRPIVPHLRYPPDVPVHPPCGPVVGIPARQARPVARQCPAVHGLHALAHLGRD